MSFVLLHKGGASTLLGDDAVVPAADVPALRRSLDLLAQADRRLDAATAEAAALKEDARRAGFDEGQQRGEAAAAAQVSARLFDLEVEAAKLRASQRTEAARLAIEIVRRIAGELGPETMVAALADKAASDLAPDTKATVKVSPATRAAVADRLDRYPTLTVIADPMLPDGDCVVETSFGVIRAGLETQLAAIERAWTSSTADG